LLAAGALTDVTRSRRDLVAENAMLCQQLIVLRRQVKRPKLTNGDRIRLVLLARITRYWQYALHIVQPDTPCAGTETCSAYTGNANRGQGSGSTVSHRKPSTLFNKWRVRTICGAWSAFAASCSS